MPHCINLSLALLCLLVARSVPAADPPPFKIQRFAGNPILRPDMMTGRDGVWSGNLNFPCLIRVPDWVEKPLGKYYLYFSAHHGSYIRLAYADAIQGPWTISNELILPLADIERINGEAHDPNGHVASPDVHLDADRKEFRMYFHSLLPKLGHKSSVATSRDGIHFEAKAGAIGEAYFRVFRHADAYFALDCFGTLLRSPDGIQPFKPVSKAVQAVANDSKSAVQFRHGGVSLDGDTLDVYFTRIGDTPESIYLTRVRLTADPEHWTATPPVQLLKPERDYEGIRFPLEPSKFTGQTNVRQLRDPFIFSESGKTFLLYATAGESGIAMAELVAPSKSDR